MPESLAWERTTADVVRFLCHLRIAVLVLALAPVVVTGSVAVVAVGVAVVPFSFVPVLTWTRRGGVYARSTSIQLADTGAALLVTLLVDGAGPAFVYDVATVALWGLAAGFARAVAIAVVLAVAVVLAWQPVLAAPEELVQVTAGVIVLVGMAWAGAVLGGSLAALARLQETAARDRERRAVLDNRLSIARDLHDTLAGEISGIRWLAGTLSEHLAREGGSARALEVVRTLDEASRKAQDDTRSALRALRSGRDLAGPLSEPDAVRLLEEWSRRSAVAVDADVEEGAVRADEDVRAAVTVVLRELLENVRRHARASTVRVVVRCVEAASPGLPPGLLLVVHDDGVGLPGGAADGAAPASLPGHFGVQGVVERVGALGGAARWTSWPGAGTLVRVEIPPRHDETPPDGAVAATRPRAWDGRRRERAGAVVDDARRR